MEKGKEKIQVRIQASQRVFYSQFVEITRDHIGNSRFADLLPADNDSSLDVIIPEPKLLS